MYSSIQIKDVFMNLDHEQISPQHNASVTTLDPTDLPKTIQHALRIKNGQKSWKKHWMQWKKSNLRACSLD